MSKNPAKPLPGDLLEGCVVALGICLGWFTQAHPEATVDVEVEPGEWHTLHMVTTIEKVLTAYRAEYGSEEDL